MNENVARVRSLQSIFRSSFLISLSRRATYACLSALSPRGRPKGGYVIHTMDMGPYRNFFSLNIDRALVACPPAPAQPLSLTNIFQVVETFFRGLVN